MEKKNGSLGERLHKIDKFPHIKGSSRYSDMSAYRLDRIFAHYTSNKGLLSKRYKELKIPTTKKTNQSVNGLVKYTVIKR